MIFILIGIACLILALDLYFFRLVALTSVYQRSANRKLILLSYFSFTLISLGLTLSPLVFEVNRTNDSFIIFFVFTYLFSKIIGVVFLLVKDFTCLLRWLSLFLFRALPGETEFQSQVQEKERNADSINRAEFLAKSALLASSFPTISMSYGFLSGAYDYQLIERSIRLNHLPRAFHGIRIAQISDIHSGSFYSKTAVRGGVDMLLGQKPDLIFFTGDLVNAYAHEMNDYFDVFERLKAPLGVYSVLGNHDYSDYGSFPSEKAKRENERLIKKAHQELGWNLLLDQSTSIKVDHEDLCILGVENWGIGRFSKYGDLDRAVQNTQDFPVRLLLSHDPSHWKAQVLSHSTPIDVQFAGHTHGAQFGVEWGKFRWSPAQYFYKQWADLYEESGRFLYVNRGFGYIGLPARVGIAPEITVITLEQA